MAKELKNGLIQVVCRGVDPEVWRRARAQAIINQIKMGPLITKLLEAWLRGKVEIKKD